MSTLDQIARDMREGIFPKKSDATLMEEWIKRDDQAWLIVHDLIEMAREDIRLKVKDAPDELVNAINMALYAIRSRPMRPQS